MRFRGLQLPTSTPSHFFISTSPSEFLSVSPISPSLKSESESNTQQEPVTTVYVRFRGLQLPTSIPSRLSIPTSLSSPFEIPLSLSHPLLAPSPSPNPTPNKNLSPPSTFDFEISSSLPQYPLVSRRLPKFLSVSPSRLKPKSNIPYVQFRGLQLPTSIPSHFSISTSPSEFLSVSPIPPGPESESNIQQELVTAVCGRLQGLCSLPQ